MWMAVRLFELEDLYNLSEQYHDAVGDSYGALWSWLKEKKGWEWSRENSGEFAELRDLFDAIVSAEMSQAMWRTREAQKRAVEQTRGKIDEILSDALDEVRETVLASITPKAYTEPDKGA